MFNWDILIIVPVLLAILIKIVFKGKVTLAEFFIQIGVVSVFVAIALLVTYQGRTTDKEVWNGQITSKKSLHVSCEHSYRCNCYTTPETCSGSGSSYSCTPGTTICQTCYDHDYDVDWRINSSTQESLNIDRIDRQGLNMPPRWGKAYVGEPFSSEHTFTNYILANPDTVMLGSKGDVAKFKKYIPEYPSAVYDYYRHDPVINMGVPGIDLNVWNWLIREDTKILGPKKQVNIIVLLVPLNDRSYTYALKDAWVGGKKNDVVIVIGSVDGHTIDFVDILSWTPSSAYKVQLRYRLESIGTLDQRDAISKAIFEETSATFTRMHMKDMRWLARSYQPSTEAMLWIFLLALLVEAGVAFATIKYESERRFWL